MADNNPVEDMTREWNYHPAVPLQNPSIFRWPITGAELAAWFMRNWLSMSERVMMVLVAIALWYFCYPSLETARSFAFGWVLQVYAINIALMILVAGLLHWFFYMRKGQGNKLKFDHRGMGTKNRLWMFSDQVHDNMFWSLTSGVAQLTLFQVLSMWLMANGYAPTLTLADNPLWFALWLIAIPMWSAFHFYWIHRLLHVPFFYKHFHSLHHRNISIGPWSGLSMHPLEHLLYLSSLCIHWVVASHPIHLYFHVFFQGPGAAMSHTGYEDLLIRDKRRLALGTFYHQLHHRYFTCNYGNQELALDRWFGTFHDGSPKQKKQKLTAE